MKNYFRLAALGLLFSFGAGAHAQVTYTNSNGSILTPAVGATNFTLVQTFTGFTNITNMTWQLTNTDTGSAQTATFNAYIGQWNTTTNALVGSLTAFGTANLSTGSIAASGTTGLSFTDSWTASNPSLTYGLILTNTGGSSAFDATITNNAGGAFFSSGGVADRNYSFVSAGSLGNFQTSLQTAGTAANASHSMLMSVTGELAATPEPQTAAAIFAGLFVAGLVGRRVRQRRAAVVVPLAA